MVLCLFCLSMAAVVAELDSQYVPVKSTSMHMSLGADTARLRCTVPEQLLTRHVIIIALTQELFKQGAVNFTHNPSQCRVGLTGPALT